MCHAVHVFVLRSLLRRLSSCPQFQHKRFPLHSVLRNLCSDVAFLVKFILPTRFQVAASSDRIIQLSSFSVPSGSDSYTTYNLCVISYYHPCGSCTKA